LCTAILWACGALYLAFCGKYERLYIIISIYVALRGFAAVLGLSAYMRLKLFTGVIGCTMQALCT